MGEISYKMVSKIDCIRDDVESINKLNENAVKKVSDLQEAVEGLKLKVSEINGLIKSVFDESNRSNMLALNASIESARLGDNAKGFLLVSQEMQALATSSKDSLTKGVVLLNDVAKEMSKIDIQIQKIAKDIDKQKGYSTDIVSDLDEIEKTTEKMKDNVIKKISVKM